MNKLEGLKAICRRFEDRLRTASAIPVKQASIVSYRHRGLEQVVARTDVPFSAAMKQQPSVPSEVEQQRVEGVLSEWDDLQSYLELVNRPGSRISSYREASPPGHTLVSFAELEESQAGACLTNILASFREAVNAEVPGTYAWLAHDSLHCSLRSLAVGKRQ
eukprot:6184346-Pleurochrysis_carterae.AAC.2